MKFSIVGLPRNRENESREAARCTALAMSLARLQCLLQERGANNSIELHRVRIVKLLTQHDARGDV